MGVCMVIVEICHMVDVTNRDVSESDLALAALFRGAKLDIVSDMTT